MTKYYVCADTYTTGDVNGRNARIYTGRVKTIVEAEADCWAEVGEKGKGKIMAWLPAGCGACNYGCMPVEAVEELGDAEIYDRMRTIE